MASIVTNENLQTISFSYFPYSSSALFYISDLLTGNIYHKDIIPEEEKDCTTDISVLPKGLYLLTIIDGEEKHEIRFSKSV